MRIIETKVFAFNELTSESKEKAIEDIRNMYYQLNDFAQWAKDDCALLEPKHDELISLFKDEYNFPLLENNRKIYYSLDRGRYIDVSNAIEVKNEYQFLKWLGVNQDDFVCEDGYYHLEYTIGKDTIYFQNSSYEHEFTHEQEDILRDAKDRFEEHCEDILNRLEADYEYRFSDKAIMEDIEANEWEFTENGEMI